MGESDRTDPARPSRLHHHAYVVRDQEATRRYYEDIIGLPLVATWCEREDFGHGMLTYCHTFFELQDGGCLAFFQYADPEPAEPVLSKRPFRPGHHVALLATAEQQREVQRRAREAGIATQLADHGYCTSLYIQDPDGLFIELTVDSAAAALDADARRERAAADLARWLAGDHSPNNHYRS